MEYIGIDMHQRESQVCMLDAAGQVVLERRVRTSRDRFAALLGTRPPARVLLEAATESACVGGAGPGGGRLRRAGAELRDGSLERLDLLEVQLEQEPVVRDGASSRLLVGPLPPLLQFWE
jgi:hypothetical protein